MSESLQIEIFSDVVCPWCFIGKRRLDHALLEIGRVRTTPVHLRWRPYQLYPRIPAEGMDRRDYLQRRYGADADPGRVPARIREEAAEVGIKLRFDLIRRTPNTLLAHRLLELAVQCQVQHELAEALFNAYFCQGLDVGNLDVLVEVAAGRGIDPAQSRAFLRSNEAEEEVRTQLERAPDIGVSGVPGYYLANGFLLPGAQTSDVMVQIINRVMDKMQARQQDAPE